MSLTGDVLGQIGAEVSLNGGVGGTIEFTGEGTDNYNELDNKPSINGVVLTGNKTTEDLHIDTGGTDDYLDLNNKPKINSVTLRGDVSSASLQISYNDLIDRPVIPDLTDLENRMDAVEGDIQSIETDIGDIGDRLIDIASDIATIQATDLVQNSDISSLKNRMNAAETSITNLGSRLTTAEGTISTHTTDISGLDTRLDTAEGDITSLEGIVGDGQQTVGSDLTDAVTQLNSSFASSLNNLKFKFVSKTISIPDGSTSSPKTVDVDLSSDLPTGASIVGVVSASIGAYRLPYTSNSGVSQTWIYRVTNSTTVVVENTTTGWGTSTIYLLVAYS